MAQKPDTPTNEQILDPDGRLKVAGALGIMRGNDLMDRIKEEAMSLDQDARIAYFAGLLQTPTGCMLRAIGGEATLAVLDFTKERCVQ